MKYFFKNVKGFTLVELVISVAIFAAMTALLLAKYGTFNQGILLTNLAYDVALTIRNAQSYGLNVKSAPTSSTNYSDQFNYPYGVHFEKNTNTFIFFSDVGTVIGTSGDGIYQTNEKISDSIMKRGSIVSDLCVGTELSCDNNISEINITFKRPNPDAIIRSSGVTNYGYAKITLKATDGSTRSVVVRSTGQIAVEN